MTQQWSGTAVVQGVAYAPVIWARPRPEIPQGHRDVPEEERTAEWERFSAAAAAVAQRLTDRADSVQGVASEVLMANAALATDKGWLKAARKRIKDGTPAARAAAAATEQFVDMFEKLGGRMAERVTDLRDIRDRVVAEITGQPEPGVPQPDEPSILFADDLAPADTAGLDPSLVIALVTRLGGPTSHTAIISRQLGIPCIVAVEGLGDIPADEVVLIDGEAGTIITGADPDEARALVAADKRRAEAIRAWEGPAQTADGHRVQVLANVQDAKAARQAAEGHPEGVGLFRTELSFLSAAVEPTVDEQAEVYRGVFEPFAGQKVVVRTLDAGSDKPLAFATLPNEENPALGVRGNRIGMEHPEIIFRQLDAIAQAADAVEAEIWVMAPMIATINEARAFAAAVRERGLKPGIMVEVPSVALLADRFLEEVEFLSIGTNDLSQYTMAADRLAPSLAHLTNAWQPAVLFLIARTAQAGQVAGKPVGVCGEAAADPLLACVLVGLGITSLSMASGAIAAVGAQLGDVSMEQCERAAEAALAANSMVAAREAATRVLRGEA